MIEVLMYLPLADFTDWFIRTNETLSPAGSIWKRKMLRTTISRARERNKMSSKDLCDHLTSLPGPIPKERLISKAHHDARNVMQNENTLLGYRRRKPALETSLSVVQLNIVYHA